MNAHDTALAFAHALATSGKAALEPVHIYAHDVEVLPDGSTQHHVTEILLPAVILNVSAEGLTGSSTVGTAKVLASVESQSDDDYSQTHSSRETAVREVFADMPALLASFAAVGTIQLLGRPCLVDNDPDIENRAFRTPYTFKVGVNVL